MGVELNFDFMYYPDKTSADLVENRFMTILPALGIYYKNNFTLPIDFIIRVGAGMSYSILKKSDLVDAATFTSVDPYFFGGVAFRYSFMKLIFIEACTDFQYYMLWDYCIVRS